MIHDVDRVWTGSMPQAYEQWLVPTVFGPFAVDLSRRVSALAPRRVLELAAGTGVLTRELVSVLGAGEVISTDLNHSMVELGREQVPAATWRQADAMALPFGPAEFDVVACQFGVMFFPDKSAAFAEARRVLAPGGTFLFNTWAGLEAHDFQAALVTALGSVFPHDPPTFIAAVPHGYADPDLVTRDLHAGGFGRVAVEEVTLAGHAASIADVASGYCAGTPLRAAIEARADLSDATAAVARAMESRFGPGEVSGRMTAYVVAATA